MAATIIDGPQLVYGNLGNIPAGTLSPEAVPDPNQDAGPNLCFQGEGILDPRLIFLKDKMQGFTGTAQAFFMMPELESIRQIPVAAGVTVASSNAVTGTPLTAVTANALGVSVGIPVRQFSPVLNAGAIINAIALDFGFAFGNVTAGSTTVPVGNGYDFFVGMPLVIVGAGGNASTPLLTEVVAVNQQGNSITIADVPTSTNTTAAIGTGDMWGPNEVPPGFPRPMAAYPFLANGPGLFLDSRQAVSRALRIVGAASSTGGQILVSGLDVYGQPMTQMVTVGAAGTAYTTKAFKYFISAVPQFSDAHTYTVATADVFGFAFRSTLFEDMEISWNGIFTVGGAQPTPTATGYLPAVLTQPSTNLLGDVRGTFQVGAIGGGTGLLSATSSNGSLSGLVLTGQRLEIVQRISVAQAIQAEQASPFYLTGVTQA